MLLTYTPHVVIGRRKGAVPIDREVKPARIRSQAGRHPLDEIRGHDIGHRCVGPRRVYSVLTLSITERIEHPICARAVLLGRGRADLMLRSR